MSDWLDDFQMMGTKLNEGEKSLMRFAMKKEQERIIKMLESERWVMPDGLPAGGEVYMPLEQAIVLIKGEI